MNELQSFFLANMVPVFFVYGLSFLFMFAVIIWQSRQSPPLELVEGFMLLAGFGLLHGLTEWTDMLRLIVTSPPTLVSALAIVKLALLATSFQYLFLFGHHTFTAASAEARMRFAVLASPGIAAVYAAILYFTLVDLGLGEQVIRLTLGVSGAALTSLAFLRLTRKLGALGLEKSALDCLVVAIAFGCYAICSGLLHDPSGQPVLVLSLPIQVYRAACAIIIAVFVARFLYFFRR